PIPQPTPGTVRIKVSACGVCHSDALVKDGLWPGIQYPRVPGHEVAGAIDAVGDGVTGWTPGQRVGVGWHGGYCGRCNSCRRGDLFACETQQITGISFDGGYGEYMIAPASAVARFPDDLSPVDSAPLLCAGITTFNALRIPARVRAMWSRCLDSAGWGIWECNTPRSAVSKPSPSRAARTKSRSPGSSARQSTSAANRKIPRPSCKSSAAQMSSFQR